MNETPGSGDPQVPDNASAGQTTEQQAPLDKSLQGKSPDEITKMYVDLSKKIGEQGEDLGKSRKENEEHVKYRQQMDTVLRAIYADPDLYQKVDSKVRELTGQEPIKPAEANKTETPTQPDPMLTDVRRSQETEIISQFERRYGIDQLDATKRREMNVAIGNALANMADPGGNKTYQEVLNSISLTKLPMFLENAYLVANRDNLVDKSKLEEMRRRRENEGATIGSVPSSGTQQTEANLTAEEKEAARKMKIPEDKYLANKKAILGIE